MLFSFNSLLIYQYRRLPRCAYVYLFTSSWGFSPIIMYCKICQVIQAYAYVLMSIIAYFWDFFQAISFLEMVAHTISFKHFVGVVFMHALIFLTILANWIILSSSNGLEGDVSEPYLHIALIYMLELWKLNVWSNLSRPYNKTMGNMATMDKNIKNTRKY